MKGGALRSLAVKEFRALLPVWIAGAAALVAGSMIAELRTAASLFALAYAAACVSLGALSLGHEYAHRTLPLALAMPVARGRLLAVKLAVLALMLASISALMWLTRPWPAGISGEMVLSEAVLLLVACCALCLAPALTMLTRSALAGAVFTIGIAGLLLTAADLAASARFGAEQAALSDAFKLRLFVSTLAGVCLAGAVAAPWLFLRLQVIDGSAGSSAGSSARAVPARSVAHAGPPPRRRSPVWLLILKELRLQEMTFAITGLYLVLWLGVYLVGHTDRGIVTSITTLYCALLAVLAGSLSSAEERQQGTLEWQLLLPMAARRQWAVKAGVTLVVAVTLAAVLPFALQQGFSPPSWRWTLSIAALTALSMYVSSLVTGGVRAMGTSVPAVVVSVAAWSWMQWAAGPRVLSWMFGVEPVPLVAANFRQWAGWYRAVSSGALAAIVVALLLFAYANHRSFAPPWTRVARQGAALFGLMVLGTLALSSLRFVRFAP